jgi:hypothetical protein
LPIDSNLSFRRLAGGGEYFGASIASILSIALAASQIFAAAEYLKMSRST